MDNCSETCSICLEEIQDHHIIKTLSCNHKYHQHKNNSLLRERTTIRNKYTQGDNNFDFKLVSISQTKNLHSRTKGPRPTMQNPFIHQI